MPTSTTVKGLNINELTEAQYDAAVLGGVIGPNELSVLTDVSYVEPSDLATVATTGDYNDLINKPTIPAAIQVSSMPVAGVDELGNIYQFIGATDASYTNGYFYKCVSDGATPPVYSWEQTDVMPAGSSLPSQTGNAGKFLTTDGTDASWSDKPLVNTATGSEALTICGTATNSQRGMNVGFGSQASGSSACAVGPYAKAIAQGAQAIGSWAEARQSYSTAINGITNAQYAIQLGAGLTNSDANTLKVGNANGNFEMMSADGTVPTARFTTDPVADGTYVPTLTIASGVATRSWSAPSGGLPSQTGQSGKFLTTDGTDASWSDKPLVNNMNNIYSIALASGATASNNGSAVGYNCNSNGGFAAGSYSQSANGAGVGTQAKATGQGAVALGRFVTASGAGSIQLGDGNALGGVTNSDANTFKVVNANGNYEMMSADGTIPEARLADTTNAAQGQVLTLDNNNNAVWQTPSTAVTSTTATLVVANWSANTQTITVNGVTSSNVVIVSPQPLSSGDYATAGVLCTAQNTNSLTFTCTQTPSNAIDLSIVIIG